MAYQCDPVIQEGPNGDVVVDFAVSNKQEFHHGSVDPNYEDYIEDQYGQMHHAFEDVEIEQEESFEYDDEEYIENMYETLPGLAEAVAWSADNFTPDEAEWYNAMIDSEDIDDLNEAVEFLLQRWTDSALVEDSSEVEEEYDDEDLREEDVDDALDYLNSQEAGGMEQAMVWMEAANDSVDSSPSYSDVCYATAEFHNGEMSAQEAVDFVVDKWGLAEAARIYRHITANS